MPPLHGAKPARTERLMLELGTKVLLSYFLGSVMGSLLLGRLKGGVDIRTMGSGNAGGTNALRTQGVGFALGVVLIDIGKGALAAGLIPNLGLPYVPLDPAVSRTWLSLACAGAAVAGHVWPVYHGFKGGKGAATFIGTFLVLGPALILPLLLVWAWIITLTGYVGLASIMAALFFPLWLAITRLPEDEPLFIYGVVMALFITWCHRSNIRRMREGTEHRNTKLMVFRRQPAGGESAFDDDA
jgi:glycerol-3-phosphate acyltransferase PlsY